MASSLTTINPSALKERIALLQVELAEAEFDLASAKPREPEGKYAVIRFSKYSSGYTFAALRTPSGLWFITQDGSRSSRQGHAPKSWDNLLIWIGERNWAGIEVLS